MSPTRITIVLGVVGLTALLALPVLAAPNETDSDNNRMLAEVREATRQYQDLEAAEADGYALHEECVSGMGFHAVNNELVDGEVDHREPEVLVYAPRGENQSLELVAVEYLSSDENERLFDRDFDPAITDDDGNVLVPPSLHAWVWQGNPEGVFHPANPNISCPE